MKPESANQMYLIVACCLTLLGVSSEHSLTTDNETKVPVVNEDNTEVTPTTEQLTDYASTRNVHLLSKTMESTNKTANSSNMNQRPEKNSEDNATEMPENTELTPMTERSTNHIITRDLQMDSRATESTNETANSIHIKQQSEKYSEGNEIELPVTNEVLTPTTELSIDYISTREVNLSSKTTESTSTTANSLEVNQYSEDHEIEKPEKTELTPTTERSTNHTSTRDLQMDSRATERTNKTANSTQINQQPEKHSEDETKTYNLLVPPVYESPGSARPC
ncbi:myb-like protein X isoform X3 [Macrobrachium rosenbergii]|uniref:myb-like protein X isoform X3 n=1 Tax=Macrobrachium rosenbergii TaxID=79674 RepID=UPI0034D64AB6